MNVDDDDDEIAYFNVCSKTRSLSLPHALLSGHCRVRAYPGSCGTEQRRRQGLKCAYAEFEAQRAKSGQGVLGEGKVSSVPPAGGSNLVHFEI